MKEFEFLQPKTLEVALDLLATYREKAVIMAGGTDIIIGLREKHIAPDFVIDIKRIPELKQLFYDETQGLHIGATVTANELAESEIVKKYYPFLAAAARSLGSKQVRNRATCVGNVVNASPLADTATPLLACDAYCVVQSATGKREIPLSELFVFVKKTSLLPGEIVTAIKVPPRPGVVGCFQKFARRRDVDLSSVCATILKFDGVYCVAFGSVAPTPIRLKKTEELLNSNPLSSELIEKAAQLAKTEVSPIDDVRASREYRIDIVGVAVKRGLEFIGGEL